MKRFSRPFFTLAFALIGFSLAAQNPLFTVGIRGGLTLSTVQISQPSVPGSGLKPGFAIGVTTAYHFQDNWFLQSGLSFITKGAKITGTAPLGFDEQMINPGRDAVLISHQHYVQLPVHLGYSLKIRPATRLVLNAGPYVAQGIGGKTRLTGDLIFGDMIENTTLEEKTFGGKGLKAFDYGLGAGVGFEFEKNALRLQYDLGLRDIGPVGGSFLPFYSSSYKNRNISLQLEIRF
ncbi:porin family protein [Larkinella bovis]|uniref:Porin family protein n=1 Tax=Larkinella bovis TaxID=683041 RepID=A0ABW0I5W7_9BACT